MVTHMEVSHGVQWTTERGAVGTDRPASAAPQAESAWRTTSGGSAQVLRRHPVDPLDRCPVEGAAAQVRELDDLLAPTATVGRGRHAARSVARVPRGPQ